MLELHDIRKVYRMGSVSVHALRGVSLRIESGAWLAIMGPSGGGKSTLMNIIGCLDTPTEGSYLLDGEEVASLGENALAAVRNQRIGFVFQSFHLLPRSTALRQVMLPLQYRRNGARLTRGERKAMAREALERVGLGDRVDHDPSELSGGQRQRVAIARALVGAHPGLLLADEPTGNLDSASGAEVLELLSTLHREQGMTIVSVTHDEEVGAHAERIIRLRDGSIVGQEHPHAR